MGTDIEMIRLRSELAALESLVIVMAKGMQGLSPRFAEGLRLSKDRAPKTHEQISTQAATPQEADLVANEFREAWERLIQRVLTP
jgi:hypothetical protein